MYEHVGLDHAAHGCNECAAEHEQLAEWLTELKQRKEAEISAPPKSNADKIRAMDDEELAEFLIESRSRCKMCKKHDEICEGAYHECWQGIDDWLKQEVKTDDER
jgi:hypothetical protein